MAHLINSMIAIRLTSKEIWHTFLALWQPYSWPSGEYDRPNNFNVCPTFGLQGNIKHLSSSMAIVHFFPKEIRQTFSALYNWPSREYGIPSHIHGSNTDDLKENMAHFLQSMTAIQLTIRKKIWHTF